MEKGKEIVTIPFVAYESSMNRMMRIIKWLCFIIAIMFIGIMVYFFLPTEVTETIDSSQSVNDIQDSEVHQNIGE